LLQQNYIKSKLMLAAIGNVSEETVNKSLWVELYHISVSLFLESQFNQAFL
jgi:hypothetical protein